MNIERINALRTAIQADNLVFAMNTWLESPNFYLKETDGMYGRKEIPHFCDSIGCIGGTAHLMRAREYDPDVTVEFLETVGEEALYTANWLGIDYEVFRELCYPSTSISWESITVEEACTAIDNVIIHNDPKWEEIVAQRSLK